MATYGPKWWRLFSSKFRQARMLLRGVCTQDCPKKWQQQLELCEAILEARRIVEYLAENCDCIRELFGLPDPGPTTDWDHLRAVAGWLHDVHREIKEGLIVPELISYLTSNPEPPNFRPQIEAVDEALRAHQVATSSVVEDLELDERLRFGDQSLQDLPFSEQLSLLRSWRDSPGSLQDIVQFNHRERHMSERGMDEFADVAASWELAGELLPELLERTWLNALADQVFQERPALAEFEGETHAEVVRRFRKLDEELLLNNRARVALKHWQKLPRAGAAGQMGILRREFEKKKRHLPIRRLINEAGPAIQQIKPVFMMSPLSVATYLPAGTVTFDAVIFDEASQVRPVDALGAIIRADQSVVVGDSKQLPPTSFFDKIADVEDEEEFDQAADMESILGLFNAKGAPETMLRWHYRSRHESLIAVSNHEFYDNRLFVFPSPDAERAESGVSLHYHPETAYELGHGKRYNLKEAEIVARAVIDHAHATPHLSLGVASFNQAQMQAIQDRVELERRKDDSYENFFRAHPEEPFFVKNLENVQGDERDVIFISIGYGKTADGRFSHNFGPLNKEGGERRLNVLITRAKHRCEVFSNFRAGDLDLGRTDARGVAALKRYLKFAEDGNLDVPGPSGGLSDSPFEDAVAAALEKLGCTVHLQVGSGGFFIDLGVVDDEHPGRYLLGIECDGATHHSARSARERDRLRQSVLEGLGWQIHRIWSTDWFRNPERELRRVAESIEAAKARRNPHVRGVLDNPGRENGQPNRIGVIREDELDLGVSELNAVKYERARPFPLLGRRDFHEVSPEKMAPWLAEVVAVESPVHWLEAGRRLTEAVGIHRIGNRIQTALRNGVEHAKKRGMIRERKDFLWAPKLVDPPVRDRSELPQRLKKIELIAPEERAAAVEYVVRSSVGISREELVSETGHLLGIGRVRKPTAAVIRKTIAGMLRSGRLECDGDQIVIGRGEAHNKS